MTDDLPNFTSGFASDYIPDRVPRWVYVVMFSFALLCIAVGVWGMQ